MITNALYIDAVIPLSVYKIPLIVSWSYYSDMGCINTANGTRKIGNIVKTLVCCLAFMLCSGESYELVHFSTQRHGYLPNDSTEG